MASKSMRVLLACALIFCSGCNREAAAPSADAPSKSDDLVSVKIVKPELKTLKRLSTQPATIHAYHQAELHAKVAGYLVDLQVDIGSHVETGDVLGVISVPEMQKARERQLATITQMESDEKSHVAAMKLAAASVTAAMASQDQAVADVEAATARVTFDQSEFQGVQELVASKSVAARLLDEARNRFAASQAAKAASLAALASAKANVTVAEQEMAVAESKKNSALSATEVARKQLEEMDELLAYATLKAPFKGVVTQRHVDLGDLVRNIQSASDSSRKPLFTVAQTEKVRVRCNVPEGDAPWANEGDAAAVKVRALRGRTFPGNVSRVTSSLDESTRTMLVEIDLDNADGALFPGMYGEVSITLEETAEALVVPATAVRFDEAGKSTLYVIGDGDVASVVEVTTGRDDGKQIQILSGIDKSARIADGMVTRLKTGQKVKVQ